jgi:hypothetical protein
MARISGGYEQNHGFSTVRLVVFHAVFHGATSLLWARRRTAATAVEETSGVMKGMVGATRPAAPQPCRQDRP